jgi:soluble lytic murein transglycosylase-like protein
MFSIKSVIVIFCFVLLGVIWSYEMRERQSLRLPDGSISIQDAPPSIRLYDYLKTYSKQYGVPFHIAYGVAHKETGYNGPFHWKYNPKQTSFASAYGAMQIQVPTGQSAWKGVKVTSKLLLTDLRFNVETSMIILSKLKKKFGRWDIALGCYNTGRPLVNSYALEIVNSTVPND